MNYHVLFIVLSFYILFSTISHTYASTIDESGLMVIDLNFTKTLVGENNCLLSRSINPVTIGSFCFIVVDVTGGEIAPDLVTVIVIINNETEVSQDFRANTLSFPILTLYGDFLSGTRLAVDVSGDIPTLLSNKNTPITPIDFTILIKTLQGETVSGRNCTIEITRVTFESYFPHYLDRGSQETIFVINNHQRWKMNLESSTHEIFMPIQLLIPEGIKATRMEVILKISEWEIRSIRFSGEVRGSEINNSKIEGVLVNITDQRVIFSVDLVTPEDLLPGIIDIGIWITPRLGWKSGELHISILANGEAIDPSEVNPRVSANNNLFFNYAQSITPPIVPSIVAIPIKICIFFSPLIYLLILEIQNKKTPLEQVKKWTRERLRMEDSMNWDMQD